MRKTLALLALSIAIIFACGVAQAATFNFHADLTGSSVVPANASPGIGSGTFVYDDVLSQLSYNIEFSGLIGAETLSHIQHAAAGVNGPIAFQFPLTGSPKAGVWTAASANPLTPELVSELFAGNLYVNIHTNQYAGGEIRGQILPVPEPASLVGLAMGACALFLRRRR